MGEDCRKEYRSRVHEMVIKVHRFLAEEYEFMTLCNTDNCNLKTLSCITVRTANATGVCMRRVSEIIREQKKPGVAKERRKARRKKYQKKNDTEDEDTDEDASVDSNDDVIIKKYKNTHDTCKDDANKRNAKNRKRRKYSTGLLKNRSEQNSTQVDCNNILSNIKQEEIEVDFSDTFVNQEENMLPQPYNKTMTEVNDIATSVTIETVEVEFVDASSESEDVVLSSLHENLVTQSEQENEDNLRDIDEDIQFIDTPGNNEDNELLSSSCIYIEDEDDRVEYILPDKRQELEIEYSDSSTN